MTIETPRLMLREYTMEDFDALYEIVSDLRGYFLPRGVEK